MGLSVVYDLPAARRNELVAWASKPVVLGWWDRPPAGVPSDLGALASYEHEALIGITALTNHLGSAAVMQEQLRHLLRISQRSGVTLQVVAAPTSFIACGWYLMDYEKAGSVVLLEHLGSSTFLFDEETAPYAVARKDLRERALSERSTRDRIEQHVLGS